MSAVLPEEGIVQPVPYYCCEHYGVFAESDNVQEHAPDCRAGIVNRRLAGEEPVAMLKSSMDARKLDVHVWKDNLPLTQLDRQAFGSASVLILLGTSDGRIGVATPRMVDDFNIDVFEAVMRYKFHNYRYEEPERRYALEPLESHGTEYAYVEQQNQSAGF